MAEWKKTQFQGPYLSSLSKNYKVSMTQHIQEINFKHISVIVHKEISQKIHAVVCVNCLALQFTDVNQILLLLSVVELIATMFPRQTEKPCGTTKQGRSILLCKTQTVLHNQTAGH
jgi:hypothetical protein